jgi:hypothetical protein
MLDYLFGADYEVRDNHGDVVLAVHGPRYGADGPVVHDPGGSELGRVIVEWSGGGWKKSLERHVLVADGRELAALSQDMTVIEAQGQVILRLVKKFPSTILLVRHRPLDDATFALAVVAMSCIQRERINLGD